MISPLEQPDLYEKIVLGGDRESPGVVTLNGHDRNSDWDVKAAKGQTGASSSLNGETIGRFEATFTLVEDYYTGVNDFNDWEEFSRYLNTLKSGPKPIAVSVYHPDLALNGFGEVTIESIGGVLRQSNGTGIVKVKFIEYKPPKPKPPQKAKASGGSPAGPDDKPPKPDPNAETKAELASLVEQAKQP